MLYDFVNSCDRTTTTVSAFCVYLCVAQGRSLRESTLRRAQRRSFTPASYMDEDVVDFPDELDTSFFARVMQEKPQCYSAVVALLPSLFISE